MTTLHILDDSDDIELRIDSYCEDHDCIDFNMIDISTNKIYGGFDNSISLRLNSLPDIIAYLQNQYDAYCKTKD